MTKLRVLPTAELKTRQLKDEHDKLTRMPNPARDCLLQGLASKEALEVPAAKPVPGRRGDLVEMTARDFLRRAFPHMSRKQRQELETLMERRDKAGLDPLTGEPLPKD